jgi:hypothetical protein
MGGLEEVCITDGRVLSGGEMVKKATVVLLMLVLSLVAACAPAAPAPTRTPEPTPVEVLATKPEHLEGIWQLGGDVGFSPTWGGRYYRWDADGTVWWAEDPEVTTNLFSAQYWFEDGLYYEGESQVCIRTGSYEAYLEIQEGRAVRLRLQVIDDADVLEDCTRRLRYASSFRRVD